MNKNYFHKALVSSRAFFIFGKTKTKFMKKILFILVMLCSIQMFAQTSNDSTKYTYCEIIGIRKFMSTKVQITVDYGENRIVAVKDDNDKVKTFNSMVDALNYMSSQGWEYIDYTIEIIANVPTYHYLLKKKI